MEFVNGVGIIHSYEMEVIIQPCLKPPTSQMFAVKKYPLLLAGFPLLFISVYPCSGWFNPHGKSLFSHGNMGVFLCNFSGIPWFFLLGSQGGAPNPSVAWY